MALRITFPGEPLDSLDLQRELDDLVTEVEHGGWLFVLRNKLPFALVYETAVQQGGVPLHFNEQFIVTYVRGLLRRGDVIHTKREFATIVVPTEVGTYFQREKALLLPGSLTPSGTKPSTKALEDGWAAFLRDWAGSGALRYFSPEQFGPHGGEVERLLRELAGLEQKRLGVDPPTPFVTFLPDVWMCWTWGLRRKFKLTESSRAALELNFVHFAHDLARGAFSAKMDLQAWLNEGSWIIVQLSVTEINQRFRGYRIRAAESAAPLLVHSALAYGYSAVV